MSSFPFGTTGSSTPAPAPAFGGFGAAAAPAPGGTAAPAGGFSFTTPAAPTTGGGGGGGAFGSATTTTPAPAAGGFGFGGTSATPAAAPTPGGFGTTTTGAFGSTTPAAAPVGAFGTTGATFATPGFGGFGATAAPAFGSPAPAPLFGGSSTLVGQPPQQQQPQQQQQFISPKTLCKDLPPHYQQGIDRVNNAMTNHRRTMARVHDLGPAPLVERRDAHGVKTIPLQKDMEEVKQELQTKIMPQLENLVQKIQTLRDQVAHVREITHVYGVWPTEVTATRRGIRLTKSSEEKKDDVAAQVQEALDKHVMNADRIERFPSPFFWQALHDMTGRLNHLQGLQEQIKDRVNRENWDGMPVTYLVQQQDEKLFFVRRQIHTLHFHMEQIRAHYARIETQKNVLVEADLKEAEHTRQMIEEYRRQTFLAQPTNPTVPAARGGAPAPAPGAFSFGPTPAPGASSAFSFSGAIPAAAPTSAFNFSTPATAAPGPTSAFGARTAAAPTAPAFGGFGSTPAAPTPAAGSGAPAAPAFGAAAPAPTGVFGAPAPATSSVSTTLTPRKSGGKSRGSRRK